MSILTYILTWRLPVALMFAVLAFLPVRKAYRQLRTGDIRQKGAVEEVFLSSLLAAIAGVIYPILSPVVIGIWIAFGRRHLLNGKEFAASLIAITVVAIYYLITVYITKQLAL